MPQNFQQWTNTNGVTSLLGGIVNDIAGGGTGGMGGVGSMLGGIAQLAGAPVSGNPYAAFAPVGGFDEAAPARVRLTQNNPSDFLGVPGFGQAASMAGALGGSGGGGSGMVSGGGGVGGGGFNLGLGGSLGGGGVPGGAGGIGGAGGAGAGGNPFGQFGGLGPQASVGALGGSTGSPGASGGAPSTALGLQGAGQGPTGGRRTMPAGSNPAGDLARANANQQLMNDFQRQFDEANAANEQRYNDILSGYVNRQNQGDAHYDNLVGLYNQRFDRNMGTIDQLGQAERNAINDRSAQTRAQAEQDLISRGLGNTTIRSSVMTGIEGDRSRQLTELAGDLARQRIATDTALSGDTLGYMERRPTERLTQDTLQFMERRNDVGPEMGQLYEYMFQLGQGQNSGGGGVPLAAGGGGGGGGFSNVGLGAPGTSTGVSGIPSIFGPGSAYQNQLAMLSALYGGF